MIITLDNKTFDTDALTQEIEALTGKVDLMKSQITGWRSKRSVKIDYIRNNNINMRLSAIESNINLLNNMWRSRPNHCKTDEECDAIAALNKGFDDLNKKSIRLYCWDLYSTRYRGSYAGDCIVNFFANIIDCIYDKCEALGKPPFVLIDRQENNSFDANDFKKDTYMLAIANEVCCISNDIEEFKKYAINHANLDYDRNHSKEKRLLEVTEDEKRIHEIAEKSMLQMINDKTMDFKNKLLALNKIWVNEPNKTDEKIALIAKLNNKAAELDNNVNLLNSDYSNYSWNRCTKEIILFLIGPQKSILSILAIAIFIPIVLASISRHYILTK